MRDYVMPQATEGNDMKAYVGGSTAGNLDLADEIAANLFLVIFAVVLLSASWCC